MTLVGGAKCISYKVNRKSRIFSKKFVAGFKTQHNATIRVLRSDGGGEYTGSKFEEWLAKMGIRHEISAPYTPQQLQKNEFTKPI